MAMQGPGEDLRGARWEPAGHGGPPFRRPLPWLAIGVVVLVLFGAFAWSMRSRAIEIRDKRSELVRRHSAVIGDRGVAITRFRTNVERMLTRAAGMHHPDVLEPGFELDSLRGRSGVYIRLRERDAVSSRTIRHTLESMEPDAIPHCLGLTPVAMRTLYTKDAPLTGEWLRQAQATTDQLRLNVRLDEIERFARRDLPVLESIAQSDYVLATIIRGESRSRDEVDLFVFDARTGAIRLATNTKANGYLLTARIEGYRAPSPSQEALARSGATDCSIAAQARTRTGEFGAAVGNGPADAGVPPDSSVLDLAVPAAPAVP